MVTTVVIRENFNNLIFPIQNCELVKISNVLTNHIKQQQI
jgi:hypothetical protein